MFRSRFLLLIALAVTSMVNFSSTAIATCITDMHVRVIPRNDDAVRVALEKLFDGRFVLPHELATIADGHYLFILTTSHELMVARRFDNPFNSVDPMSSHRALINRFAILKGVPPKVGLAGEFQISHHLNSRFNNKSNTLHSDTAGINWGLPILENEFGLQYQPGKTVFKDWSKEPPKEKEKLDGGHENELSEAEAMLFLYGNSERVEMMNHFHDAEDTIYAFYQDKEPGKVSWGDFLDSTKNLMTHDHSAIHEFEKDLPMTFIQATQIAQFLVVANDPEEKYRMLSRIVKLLGDKKASDFFMLLSKLEGWFSYSDLEIDY